MGERNFGFDSLKPRLKRDMEERDCCRMRAPGGAAPPPPEEFAYDRGVGTMERPRNGLDLK